MQQVLFLLPQCVDLLRQCLVVLPVGLCLFLGVFLVQIVPDLHVDGIDLRNALFQFGGGFVLQIPCGHLGSHSVLLCQFQTLFGSVIGSLCGGEFLCIPGSVFPFPLVLAVACQNLLLPCDQFRCGNRRVRHVLPALQF